MKKPHPLDACRAALVQVTGLEALAPLRARGGIRVVPGDPAWVTWDGDRPDVISALVAVPGADLFEPRDGHWFRLGAHLPAFELPPPGDAVPIDRAVLPAAVVPTQPAEREPRRVPLRLIRTDVPRPASALRCPIGALNEWADTATTGEIAAVKAARSGDVAWLLGNRLPALASAERFWGERVLIPLGFRADPDWPEAALREAAGVGPDEILVLSENGAEAIPSEAFRPLTRAMIRMTV